MSSDFISIDKRFVLFPTIIYHRLYAFARCIFDDFSQVELLIIFTNLYFFNGVVSDQIRANQFNHSKFDNLISQLIKI